MKSLLELYQEHDGKVSDKWMLYLAEYDRLFSEYRDQPVKLLEIGIQNGGSLDIWAKYFPHAHKLIGCDINPDCAQLTYDDPCIALVIGDANSSQAEAEILAHSEAFDLIIDDGSHTSIDIVRTFSRYFSRLNDGGLYVVEDLHCSYWQQFGGGLYAPYSSIAFFKRLADVVNHQHWGVDKASTSILDGFAEVFDAHFDAGVLATVHSIEFVNSMCIVRKAPLSANQLGSRFIAGTQALAVPAIADKSGELAISLSQSDNPWTALPKGIEELWLAQQAELEASRNEARALQAALRDQTDQLLELRREHDQRKSDCQQDQARVAELENELREVRSSTSWRVTEPLRLLGGSVVSLRSLANAGRKPLQDLGATGLARKVVSVTRTEGLAGLKRRLQPAFDQATQSEDYAAWIKRHEVLTDAECRMMLERINAAISQPLISVVVPTYNPDPRWLCEAIDSVVGQSYGNWELCIADDASTDPQVRSILEKYAHSDSRIKVVFRTENGHISAASNSALEVATGAWVALLDHDDLLARHALLWVLDALMQQPDAGMIYSDEDKIDAGGRRQSPFFKPDWSPHLAMSQAYVGHLCCIRRDLLTKVGGFAVGMEGAQDYALWLSVAAQKTPIVHVAKVLYHWRMHPGSTAAHSAAKPYAHDAGRQAIQDFVDSYYPQANIQMREREDLFTYQATFAQPQDVLVSIIIPTRDRVDLLGMCIDSILSKSSWQHFEIIVIDNGSVQEDSHAYFAEITQRDARVKVTRIDEPFNWSRLNNLGAEFAKGDLLVFLNNDTVVIAPDWLQSLAGYAFLPDVALVGGLLLFEDGTIQHAGVVVGMGGWADHVYRTSANAHFPGGPFVSPVLTRNVLSVTGACTAITRAKFEELGRYDEAFIICGSDVELGIRAWKKGYYNVQCAEVKLYHYESKTRSPHVPAGDFEQSVLKYAPYQREKIDPFYNPNLSLQYCKPGLVE